MVKVLVVLACCVCMGMAQYVQAEDRQWVWQDTGSGLRDIRALLIDEQDPRVIYAAARGGVFRSGDLGQTWERVFSAAAGIAVNNLCFGGSRDVLYAAADNGVYCSLDRAGHWRRILAGCSDQHNRCRSVGFFAGIIYAGTEQGLRFSEDGGKTWHAASGIVERAPIVSICARQWLVIASENEVFVKRSAEAPFEKIWGFPMERIEPSQEDTGGQDSDVGRKVIRCIGCGGSFLVVGVDSRIMRYDYAADSWSALSTSGLRSDQIYTFLPSAALLLAGTQNGVFVYRDDLWDACSSGLGEAAVNALAAGPQGSFYAGGDNGFYRGSAVDSHGGQQVQATLRAGEPGIRQVQNAAIAYADVDNQKISSWRKQASQRGWLPKLSVGIDRDTSDLWHWEGGSTVIEDDDFLRKGRVSVEWDVSLSWDLADLVWSQDQTSIDVRSKLMVELRDDVLDQVTKLYFERVRLAEELKDAPEGSGQRFNKELKFREVTALLDGLTGGLYSETTNAIP